jgi:2-methylcitrate dehydratase PrpD
LGNTDGRGAAAAGGGASLTETLVGILRRPVSESDRERAALHVLDWVGCAAAGAATETGAVFGRAAAARPPGPAPTLYGVALQGTDAAFVEGALGTLLEMDDLHRAALLHPAPVVVPTALALGAEHDLGGRHVLDAVVRGYEAMIRLGRAVGPAHYRHFHNTSTCGPLGAAVAAGDLLGDDALLSAMGNAVSTAGGLWQTRLEPVMTKALHTARAAQAGAVAAELAGLGLTGPVRILDGALGFFAGLAPDGDPNRVVADPDAPWLITEVSFKPWPACRHTHPAIDAALALRGRIGTRAIRSVVVRTYADAIAFCDAPEPRTSGEARFSLQHATAVALCEGPPRLVHFEPSWLPGGAVAGLRARTTLVIDPRYGESYPARFGSGLTVELESGEQVEADMQDAWGDPENPLGPDAIRRKAEDLMSSAGWSADRIEASLRAIQDLLADGSPRDVRSASRTTRRAMVRSVGRPAP